MEDELGKLRLVDLVKDNWEWRPEEVFIVVLPRSDHFTEDAKKAKANELELLEEFDVYQEENYEDLSTEDQKSIVSTTWVVTEKEKDDKKIIKARLCARGFEEKTDFRRDSPTISKRSLRIMLAVIVTKGWRVKALDAKSAFLQGTEIERKVYVKPPPEAERKFGSKTVWLLKKCLYGLGDAPRSWYLRVDNFLTAQGCVRIKSEPALYTFVVNDELHGVLGSHVDDFLFGGTEQFEDKVIVPLMQEFVVGEIEVDRFLYVGWNIQQDKDGSITVDINHTVQALKEIVIEAEDIKFVGPDDILGAKYQKIYRSRVGALNWLACCNLPELAWKLVVASTKFGAASLRDLKRIQKLLLSVKEMDSSLVIPNMGSFRDLKVHAFGDGAFANIPDRDPTKDKVFSSLGQAVILEGKDNTCTLIDWSSNKAKRVVRSALAAEIYACGEAADSGVLVRYILASILGWQEEMISLLVTTDSNSLNQAAKTTSVLEDKRLRIALAELRESLDKNEFELWWKAGKDQPADVLTKDGSPFLIQMMREGKYDPKVGKYEKE